MASKIKVVTARELDLTMEILVFDDWYEFADYIKQENLQGRAVTVTHWEYVECVEKLNGA